MSAKVTVKEKKLCASDGCCERPLALSEHCWEHIRDKDSYSSKLLEAINGGGDFSNANLRKIVLRKVRIEKARLKAAELSQADLSGSHFFDTVLDFAELIGADLSECDLSHCSLKAADLTKARLTHARLWNAELAGANLTESDLSGADFWNANLYDIKLWHTALNGTKSVSRLSFSGGTKPFDSAKIHEGGALSAEDAYRNLKQYFISNGMYNDASWASFKEKSMERLVLKKKGDWNYVPSMVMNMLCGYGEKPYRIILTAISSILLFALLYFSFGAIEFSGQSSYMMHWYDYIYYSAITFTTVGYGDFIPKDVGFFRLLAAAEAFCGVFITGLFIFTLARKYSAR
jgi:uncharacterized protein YjbI with pentapeptide repeats